MKIEKLRNQFDILIYKKYDKILIFVIAKNSKSSMNFFCAYDLNTKVEIKVDISKGIIIEKYNSSYTIYKDEIYVYGGHLNSKSLSNDLSKFVIKMNLDGSIELTEETVSTKYPPCPRSNHTLTYYKDDIFVLIGGCVDLVNDLSLNDILIFNKLTATWTPVSQEKNSSFLSRYDHSCNIFGNYLFVYGGKNQNKILTDLNIISFNELLPKYAMMRPMNEGRLCDSQGFTSIVVNNPHLYIGNYITTDPLNFINNPILFQNQQNSKIKSNSECLFENKPKNYEITWNDLEMLSYELFPWAFGAIKTLILYSREKKIKDIRIDLEDSRFISKSNYLNKGNRDCINKREIQVFEIIDETIELMTINNYFAKSHILIFKYFPSTFSKIELELISENLNFEGSSETGRVILSLFRLGHSSIILNREGKVVTVAHINNVLMKSSGQQKVKIPIVNCTFDDNTLVVGNYILLERIFKDFFENSYSIHNFEQDIKFSENFTIIMILTDRQSGEKKGFKELYRYDNDILISRITPNNHLIDNSLMCFLNYLYFNSEKESKIFLNSCPIKTNPLKLLNIENMIVDHLFLCDSHESQITFFKCSKEKRKNEYEQLKEICTGILLYSNNVLIRRINGPIFGETLYLWNSLNKKLPKLNGYILIPCELKQNISGTVLINRNYLIKLY